MFDFSGKHYTLIEQPRLAQALPIAATSPIIVGGHGAKRTPRLAATYADEFNVPFSPLDVSKAQFERVDMACAA